MRRYHYLVQCVCAKHTHTHTPHPPLPALLNAQKSTISYFRKFSSVENAISFIKHHHLALDHQWPSIKKKDDDFFPIKLNMACSIEPTIVFPLSIQHPFNCYIGGQREQFCTQTIPESYAYTHTHTHTYIHKKKQVQLVEKIMLDSS